MSKLLRKSAYTVSLCLIVLLPATQAFAQGKGRGGGGGRGSGNAGGQPSGTGVGRGVGTSSSRSDGRADEGRGTASEKSKGRSDAGLERARQANLRRADDDLRNHPNLPRALHTNANDLRAGYQAALIRDPDLSFGNYVAATRLGQNLGDRHPAVTRDAILNGLASGRSIGRTLQDLGLSERDSKDARRRVDDEIKKAKKNR